MLHLFAASLLVAVPQSPAGAGSLVEPAPRLVVMLAVDQLFPAQLERLGPHLTGGLGRLLRGGTVYREAFLPYARTETGAGHVSYSTGCLPSSHGVVGNGFWDRELGREQYCVEDGEAFAIRQVGEVKGTGQRSPRNLGRPTLAELLQDQDPGTRVVSISGKDRAAIGMAGRARGDVLWWDRGGGGFQSSSWYARELPGYARAWNEGWIDRHKDWVWRDTSPYPDGNAAALGAARDDRAGERPRGDAGVTFPYPFPSSESPAAAGGWVFNSPMVDSFVIELALGAIDERQLGQRDVLDMLLLSFSGCDICGHQNGPYSREVTDLLFRLDRRLAELFARLDEAVGAGRWIASLTSDHGVMPLPEALREQGVNGRRVTPDEIKVFRGALVERLSERLGARVRHSLGPGGIVLDGSDLAAGGIDPVEARAVGAAVVRELRAEHDWIQDAWSIEAIAALPPETEGVEALIRNSFYPSRTIDIVMIHPPYVIVGGDGKGTSHGSPHPYDRHVPIILYGGGFAAELCSEQVGSQDIVPTLLGRLGMATGATFDGRDLSGH